MQVSVESTSTLGRRMTLEVPSERIEKTITERLINLSKKAKLSGFRPGKAPLKIIEQQYGETVRDEVLHDLMQTALYEALVKEKINPVGAPHIHHDHDNHPQKGEPLKYSVDFEVLPEIEIPDFSSLKIERLASEVTEADVEKTLETIRKQHIKWEPVSRAAATGDQVEIDFDGSIAGEVLKNGSSKNFKLELGSNSMIPGFETGLVGVTPGQDLTIQATFPVDYNVAELAGKTADFKIHVHAVNAAVLPAIDDEFAKLFGIKDGLQALKTEIRKNMERELAQVLKNKVKQQIMEALYAQHKFDLPKVLVDQEVQHLQQQMHERLGGKVDFKLIAEHSRGEFEEQARRRAALGLLLAEIIKKFEIKPDAEKVRLHIESMAAAYEKPAEVVTWLYQDKQRFAEVEAIILEEQVVEKILAAAKVTDKNVDFSELMQKSAPAA